MWLMTKFGFYSIVEKQEDTFHVRSRERQDLENLIREVPLSAEISTATDFGMQTDYTYRLLVGREEVTEIMAFLARNLDYSNFKNEVSGTPGQEHKCQIYHDVWSLLASALGAYGGRARVGPEAWTR